MCGGIGAVSGRRVPVDQVEFVVEQYRARYWDLTVKHFPEALQGGARLCAELHLDANRAAEPRAGGDRTAPGSAPQGAAALSGKRGRPTDPLWRTC
jgi:hypothetical protein